MCGLVGVAGASGAASIARRALLALQHRGQESAGVISVEAGRVEAVRGMGLVSSAVPRRRIAGLSGTTALGHTRYSTTGASVVQNVQPLAVRFGDTTVWVAHNGNVPGIDGLRRTLGELVEYSGSSDSEVLAAFLACCPGSPEERVRALVEEVVGAFALVALIDGLLVAARDRHGFRPLWLGRLGEGSIVASETCGLQAAGASDWREIEPGGIVAFRNGEPVVDVSGRAPTARCVFEAIYLASPASDLGGERVASTRARLGAALAASAPVDADIVVPIPRSGNEAAAGFAEATEIPLVHAISRLSTRIRTFLAPDGRETLVAAKYRLCSDVRGQRVALVDDSLVRGHTARGVAAMLKANGARAVHLRVASPPLAWPCYFGVDIPTTSELLLAGSDPVRAAAALEVDSVAFLGLAALRGVTGRAGWCTGCLTGSYPVPTRAQAPPRTALELTPLERS